MQMVDEGCRASASPSDSFDVKKQAIRNTNAAPSGGDIAVVTDDDGLSSEQHLTTEVQTFLHILKGYVGPGCLSLPWAYSQLGLPLGFAATLALSLVTSYNALVLLGLKRILTNKREATYSDIGGLLYGENFRSFVTLSVCVQQLAICTVYFSFIGENVVAVARYFEVAGILAQLFSRYHVVVCLTLPLAIGLSLLPNLRVLAPVTAAATLCLSLAFVFILETIRQNWDLRPELEEIPGVQWSKAPMAICAIMYSYEGICLVLPVESAMMRPRNFERIFVGAMVVVCAVFAAFASICVIAFGSVDNGSITAYMQTNFDRFEGDGFVLAANALTTVSVLLTYPLQLFPCVDLVRQFRRGRGRISNCGRSCSSPCVDGKEEDEQGATAAEGVEFVLWNDGERHVPSGVCGYGTGQDVDDKLEWSTNAMNEASVYSDGDSPWMRVSLVVGTCMVALVIPNVQELISLAGALAGSMVALIIPPLLELRYRMEFLHRFSAHAIKCYLLILLGLVACVAGTIATIKDIMEAYRR